MIIGTAVLESNSVVFTVFLIISGINIARMHMYVNIASNLIVTGSRAKLYKSKRRSKNDRFQHNPE